MAAAALICYVRFFNELPMPVQFSQRGGSNADFDLPSRAPTAYYGSTEYTLCGTPLLFTAPSVSINITVAPQLGSSHYTVLLLSNSSATVLQDTDVGYSDTGRDSIDLVSVRIVNALPYAIDVYGGPSECYNCALPRLSGGGRDPIPPGGAWATDVLARYDYFNVRAWAHSGGSPPWVVSLPVAGAADTQQLATLREHGVYTLLLHPDGSSTLIEDVAGRNAYLPILYAVLILGALGVAHRLAGRAYAQYYQERLAPPLPPKGEVTLVTFFGLHKVLARARAGAEGGAGGGEGLAEGLLSGSLQEPAAAAAAPSAPALPRAKPERVLSLDTFRGFSLCLMMFANFDGGVYWFFDHARWNGLTVADLLFPWFVFMSGVSAAMSFASERRRGAGAGALALKSLVRCIKLLALGLLVVNNPTYLPGIRAFSVLSYFAMSYLVIGLVDACVPVLGAGAAGDKGGDAEGQQGEAQPEPTWPSALYTDFGRYALQWGVMGGIAAVYLLLRFFLPVPGCPTGYAGPGGLADQGAYDASCVGGAAGYLNIWLFGPKHSYGGPTCKDIYGCGPYDPEGALGALMASWMAWLGLSAGRMLEAQRAESAARGKGSSMKALAPGITRRWVTMGLLLCLGAGILCGCEWEWQGYCARAHARAAFHPFSLMPRSPFVCCCFTHPPLPRRAVKKEGGFIPVSKNLWSPSFILLLAGFGHLNLALLFNVVDVAKAWSGAPFRYVGKNSLATYVTSELLSDNFPLKTYLFGATAAAGWVSHADALFSNILGICSLLAAARYWHLTGFSWNV